MSRTTVAYVCADPGIPVFGTKGASVHIQELVRAWRARGAHVEVFAVRRGNDVPADLADLTVHLVPVVKPTGQADEHEQVAARERAQREAAAELSRRVLALAPDVVHERYSLFSTVLADVRAGLGEQRRADTILEVNSPLIDEQRDHRVLVDEAGALRALTDQLAAADVVACVSDPVADWVRGHLPGGAVGPHVLVTPNGVNTDRIRPVAAEADTDPVVVFVGTLKPWHGVEDLMRAAALARGTWRLRIIGDGPRRAAVEQLARRCGRPVELLGAVPPEQVPAALAGATLAVAPYPHSDDHYFSPLKVYEYGAAALPTIASRIGQIPQVVRHGRTGLLVAPSDPAALAEAIDDLVSDPERARAWGAEARRMMCAEHSWHAVLASTVAALGAPSLRGARGVA